MNYNLGSKDITVGDLTAKVNDGKYHVVRFSRAGANSTLQIDDNSPQSKFPLGKCFATDR
jgi:neurexin